MSVRIEADAVPGLGLRQDQTGTLELWCVVRVGPSRGASREWVR